MTTLAEGEIEKAHHVLYPKQPPLTFPELPFLADDTSSTTIKPVISANETAQDVVAKREGLKKELMEKALSYYDNLD